jgi:type IV secretory pathway TraG/TraD family ATPase VirD4
MSARIYALQIASAVVLTVACLWAATQWAAAMLGYQPALGTPWLDLLGLEVYAPWKLFPWWIAFDDQAPGVFARAGAVAALGGLLSGAVAVGGAAWRASLTSKATTYGSARWADTSDVDKADLLGHRGVVLGLYQDRYLRHDGPEHVLAVAPTRSGNHLGTQDEPMVHPLVASVARELLNKSDNERSGVVSTAMSLLGLYRDPIIAANTARCDWRIADLVNPRQPASLYLVVPPSDISRTKPLVRLILNQIAHRLTETLPSEDAASSRRLLLMLDEFPALGRLDFFESSLAFMAGYGVRAFLVAQSLHQIDKAYGLNHAILDNCHVRVVFAPNDERTAKRLSEALGTATEQRAQRNLSGGGCRPGCRT